MDDIRVRGTGKACTHNPVSLPEATGEPEVDSVSVSEVLVFMSELLEK